MTCLTCGKPARPITVERDGVDVASGFLCDPCLDAALAGAAEWRRQFDELIASGVSNADANRTIIARMNAQEVS